ncbi:hypothetical protein ABZ330_16925 [Streptomyces sp. NPDC006172]|uniref:hypothetical protein n=1 Tax=Streptomyces sp. NPDC006172 TaxID=3154470 RepID=UPI0033FB5585
MSSSTRRFLATVLGALTLSGVVLIAGTGVDGVQSVRADEAPAVTVPHVTPNNETWD